MYRTESAEGPAPQQSNVSAARVGGVAAKLAGWGLATVAVTYLLLRPGRRSGGRRGLFFGSGLLVVLAKSLIALYSDSPAPAAVPALSAATPASAPVKAPAPAKAVETVRPTPAKNPAPLTPVAAQGAPGSPRIANPFARPPAAPAAATPAAPAPARPPAGATVLGPRYTDKVNGYSIQFPAGWTYKTFSDGGGWILDATDGKSAVISVGFSPFPSNVTVEQISPDRLTQGLQRRAGTTVYGSGYSAIAGRKCLWHKYTGPIPRTDGNPKMTAVHYLLPLQDGRALELRLAATPEKFNEVAGRMKASVDSFKLLSKSAPGAATPPQPKPAAPRKAKAR